MKRIHLALPALLSATLVPAFAQGGDDCASATAISGPGIFAFDQTTATASGVTPICGSINFDVWFAWTATQTADHVLTTCGQAPHDTKIAVYDGCAGAEIVCNDDACGLQSSVTFSAVAGTTYYLQIGTYGTVAGNVGNIELIPDLPVVNPATGHAYKLYQEYLDWDSANIAAQSKMFNGAGGHLAAVTTQVELDWLLNNLPGMTGSRPWIGLYQDTNDPSYSEPLGGWKWVTGEPFTFSNWAAGEPNDISASGGPENYAEMFGSGEWNDAELFHAQTTWYLVEWDGGPGGTTFCDPADNNTTGVPTRLVPSTTTVGSGLHLDAQDGPPSQFGYFMFGTDYSEPGLVISDGHLCLAVAGGNQIARYNVVGGAMNSVGQFDSNGDLVNFVGTSTTGFGFDVPNSIPLASPNTIMAGDTWAFQLWHREPAGHSNFSNGISWTF
ncbi:MAG: lectin-like protein [Planctomycetota bacterium]